MQKTKDLDALIAELRAVSGGTPDDVLADCGADKAAYDKARQVFNRRFQFRPAVIVRVQSADHVSKVLSIAERYGREIRVRSGGHDHEGECSATDAVLIDFSKMHKVTVDKEQQTVTIEPGAIFKNLINVLNKNNVGIPHGTCGTVAIAGFTMGGGWGPWTRQKGMCCESLVGATIVLGDGSIKKLTVDGPDKELLWALRGGGGMSYGIVTELVIKTFPLPENTIKFNVVWNDTPALRVLEVWESLIAPGANYNLLGTNLQIMAKPPGSQPIEASVHKCVFNGYFAGTNEELEAEIARWFADLPPSQANIPPSDDKNNLAAFDSWDRISATALRSGLLGYDPLTLIPPDVDPPAPHKISSRLVQKSGLGDEGRKNLIRSLESDLLSAEGADAGVLCYVTLGAICGPYYAEPEKAGDSLGVSFPYRDRPYTIQYQVWWNEGKDGKKAGQAHDVNRYTNEAMDWIEVCRGKDFPQTEGAFISFKDAGIPTRNYFQQNFEKLRAIKMNYSRDPKNRFRSRKTII